MEHWLVLYVANAIWRIPLVAIAAALAMRIAGLGPEGRHRVWLGALALAVVVPAAPGLALIAPSPVGAPAVMPAIAVPADATASALPPLAFDAGAERLIALMFAAFAAFGLVRLVVSWRGAGRLADAAHPVELAPGLAAALASAARAHRVPTPAIKCSEDVSGPVVVGAFRPAILAPGTFFRLGEAEQLAALMHELAHVVRRDFAANLVCEAVALPGAWHPVMYEIKSGVRRSREIACDAMASAAVGSPAAYARRLLALAEAFGPPRDAAPVAMALIGDGALEERLMHLIGGRRAARPSRARAAGALAVGAALLAPVLCLHVAPALAAPSMPAIAPVVAPAAPIAPAPVASTPPPLAPIHRVRLAHAMRAKPAPIVVAVNEPAMAAQPPVPPAPPAPLAAPPAPPVPPVPPAPPAVFVPPVDAAAISARIDAAMARAQRANAVAMAQLRAHSGELSSAQRAQMEMEIRRSVQEAMEESRREVHAAMDSPEVRRAMSEAKMRQYVQPEQIREQVRQQVRQAMAEAMRAMSEAQAGLKDAPGD